jgi:hypothetical protein
VIFRFDYSPPSSRHLDPFKAAAPQWRKRRSRAGCLPELLPAAPTLSVSLPRAPLHRSLRRRWRPGVPQTLPCSTLYKSLSSIRRRSRRFRIVVASSATSIASVVDSPAFSPRCSLRRRLDRLGRYSLAFLPRRSLWRCLDRLGC